MKRRTKLSPDTTGDDQMRGEHSVSIKTTHDKIAKRHQVSLAREIEGFRKDFDQLNKHEVEIRRQIHQLMQGLGAITYVKSAIDLETLGGRIDRLDDATSNEATDWLGSSFENLSLLLDLCSDVADLSWKISAFTHQAERIVFSSKSSLKKLNLYDGIDL